MVTETVVTALTEMWRKGLILRHAVAGKPNRYMASQFGIGMWEFQVNRLTPALVAAMEASIPTLFRADVWRPAPMAKESG